MSSQYIKIPLKTILNITKIVTVYSFDFSPTYRTEGEEHDFWELVYVDRGELFVQAAAKRHHLTQGQIIFHRPNEFHTVECDGRHSASVFIITFDCRSSAMRFFHQKLLTLPDILHSLMRRLMAEAASAFHVSRYPLVTRKNAPIGSEQLVRLYLEEILIRLIRSEEEIRPQSVFYVSRECLESTLAGEIRSYLSDRIYGKVTLEQLCDTFHFGKSHLCDIFKKSTGESILRYYNKLKLTEAKKLLREERMTISEISAALGYESPEYFSRSFTARVGMSPRSFRNRLLSSDEIYTVPKK